MKQVFTLKNKDNLIIMITGLISGFFVLYPISDFDIFWHLAAGREIFTTRHFLYYDPFSFTSFTQRWFDVHWFFQVTVYLVEHFGSISVLLVFKSILFATSITILCKCTSHNKFTPSSGLLILIVIFTFRFLVPMRPIIFSILFLSLYFFLLERYSKDKKIIYLVALLPVQIAWVNSQGLFMIGPFLYLAYFAGEFLSNFLYSRSPEVFKYCPDLSKKDLFRALFFCILLFFCTLVNPYAQDAILFSLRLFGNINPTMKNIYSVNVPENMPLPQMLFTDYSYYVYMFTGLILILSISSFLSLSMLRFSFLFSSFIFMTLSYMAQRNLLLFALAFIPHFCWNVKHIRNPLKINSKIVKNCFSILLCLYTISLILNHCAFLGKNPFNIAPFSFPVSSTSYLLKNHIPGNMFNADRHGGYLIWKTYPQKKVFIDTRLTLRSREFFAEYLSILQNPKYFFPAICKKFSITQVIVPLANIDIYFKLANFLYNDSSWNLVYTNGSEALFIIDSLSGVNGLDLKNSKTVDSIYQSLKVNFAFNSDLANESIFHFANFLLKINNIESAESLLLREYSEECRMLLAKVKRYKGENENAILILQKIVSQNPRNTQAKTSLASIYKSINKHKLARDVIFSVLFTDPTNFVKILKEI